MGGPGSGNSYGRSGNGRSKVEDQRRLDVRNLHRAGVTKGWRGLWTWSVDGERTASVNLEATPDAVTLAYNANGEPLRYTVRVEWTRCHYGGNRPWFCCPAKGCGRRCAVLYGGRVFACRSCHQLAYSSQSENRSSRLMRKADKIRARLGAEPRDDVKVKPPRMHWRTFERLAAEAARADCESLLSIGGSIGRMLGSTAS